MSTFSGKQGKGAMRAHRALQRAKSLGRQGSVQHDRTRAHRLGKCACEVAS